jgi:polyisoprenoid-binding protein YceI
MKRVLILVGVVVLIGVGVLAYSFLKPPEEASGPIEAIPVAVASPESTEPLPPATATPAQVEETSSTTEDGQSGSAGEPVATEAPADDSEPATDASAGPVIFEIIQAESEVRFLIDEVLRGQDTTVVGTTDQIAGEIAVYPDNPARSQIGTLQVNARTLTTDNEFRNRAIKNRILETNQYEFVTFTPTELSGLPDNATIGERYSFQIVGDLTIRDVTRSVTFDASLTPVSETRIEGSASTTILYADFDITIPDAPAVASVEDEVILEIDFVALPK